MFGLIIAFEKYIPAKGLFKSKWVGLDNLLFMFQIPDSKQVFLNTIIIAFFKIIAGIVVPLFFALLLNEVTVSWYKRTVQTIVYLPHFLSWVILSGMVINIFAYDGIINKLFSFMGIEPVMFMGSNFWFRPILILTDIWREFGFISIIFLAALANINTNLYEASTIDGASRFQKLIYITLPGILPTIVLLSTLSIRNILNAGDILYTGFDQIFNLYNPLVYPTADIIDTYVYRTGLVQMQYGLATAVGMMKSVISLVLIIISNRLANRLANYRIF
jgi:ABC-type polysaccharide transport system, permease component